MLRFVRRSKGTRADRYLTDVPEWLEEILRSRGADTPEKAERFLNPSLDQLLDPMRMQDMDKALEIIRRAIAEKQEILVYGDYDVDGICATSILLETLREEGARVSFRIPDRQEEGYGLNKAAVREIAETYRLLITVDCGVTNHEEVALARELGMTVIVSDHHTPDGKQSPADAVLNPLLGDYPFRRLCGAGVALKICQALQGMKGVKKRLELAALATVADVVPLTDENRVIVSLGLKALSDSARPGIRHLIEVSGIHPPVRSEDIAFRLAPRLNAGGRLEGAGQGVSLLTTTDEQEAREIAMHLEEENRERQRLETEIVTQVRAAIPETVDFRDDRVIVVMGDGWNKGLVGLAAGKIREKYNMPTIILSRNGEEATGSCRSVPGVNIYEALSACGDLFLRFGGHEQAAGLTMRADLVDELRRRLNLLMREKYSPEVIIPVQEYDLRISLAQVDMEMLDWLKRLEPTGCGNPAPAFLSTGVELQQARRVGKDGSHLKLRVSEGTSARDGIAFGLGDEADAGYHTADLLFSPSLNEFNGRVSVQLTVQGMRPAEGSLPLPGTEAIFSGNLQEMRALAAKCNNSRSAVQTVPMTRLKSMAEGGKGLLMIAHTAERAAAALADTGADVALGRQMDPRGFNTVLFSPVPEGLQDVWRQILLLDGDLWPGESALLKEKCPRAELLALTPAADTVSETAALAMDRESLGNLYRRACRLQHGGPEGLKQLERETGLSTQAVLCGLQIFDELGLCRLQTAPFDVRPVPWQEKKNLEDSALYGWLNSLREEENRKGV